MNILIVDDEVIVVNLLKKHIDWEALGIQNVFTAYTAMDARSIVEAKHMDIIICDIEMPQENGLSFLSWVREKSPEVIKIILTGYPDFKYAQDAITIGVVKYLLKPVSFEDLSQTVRQSVLELHKRQDESTSRHIDSKREEKIFYTHLINADILPFSEFIDKALAAGGLHRENIEAEGLVYIRLAGTQVQMKNDSILLFALSNIAEELFSDITEIHLWDNIFWIVKSECDRTELHNRCDLFLSKLKGRLPGDIAAYFLCHVSLETLSERAGDLRHAAMQYRNVGQSVYDVDGLIESVMDMENGGKPANAWAVVEEVKAYIHGHYMEDISRQDIEESIHLNGDYLNRVFKKATGYSLVQYIQYYRIVVSKRLLAEGSGTITDVGIRVGFDTPSYFTKIFKKWTKMTPCEYYNSMENR